MKVKIETRNLQADKMQVKKSRRSATKIKSSLYSSASRIRCSCSERDVFTVSSRAAWRSLADASIYINFIEQLYATVEVLCLVVQEYLIQAKRISAHLHTCLLHKRLRLVCKFSRNLHTFKQFTNNFNLLFRLLFKFGSKVYQRFSLDSVSIDKFYRNMN